MRIILDISGAGITLVSKTNVTSNKGIWLAESLKIAWMVWSQMGWFMRAPTVVKANDWKQFLTHGIKAEIMADISRFNRITQAKNFDLDALFDDGWCLIVLIARKLGSTCIHLHDSQEVREFRSKVAVFILAGIERGLKNGKPDFQERFIYTAKTALFQHPVHVHEHYDVNLFNNTVETTVHLTVQKQKIFDYFEACPPTIITN